MIVLKSTPELKIVFNKLIKTLSVPVDWDGNFVISGNFLILPGKERSVIFNYDTRRVTTNLSDTSLSKKNATPIEKDSQLVNIFNLVLYAFGKWGALKGITVEKDYKKISALFTAVFGDFGVSAEYTAQHCFWYKDGTRITYEDAIQLAIDNEQKNIVDEEVAEEETGLWHSTVWKVEDEQFGFEKLSMSQRRKGRIGHNFYKVGYDCPHCGNKLYMASFSGDGKPIIDTVEGRVQLARAFFCPKCVIFYTPLPDAGLEDEEAYCLDFDGDRTAGNDYMEMLGKLGTKEPNGEFNKYVDRVKDEGKNNKRENLNDIDKGIDAERKNLNGIDKGIKDERRNLNGIDKGITDERKDLNGIDKGIKDERRNLNGIDKGITDERKDLNGIDKGIKDERRNLNGIDKGITDERKDLNGIDKGIKDERRNLNGIDKGIIDEWKNLNGIDKGIIDERRSLNEIDKGIIDERRNLNGIDKGIKDERRNLNGIDKGIEDEHRNLDGKDHETRDISGADDVLVDKKNNPYGNDRQIIGGRRNSAVVEKIDNSDADGKENFRVRLFSDIYSFFKNKKFKNIFRNLFQKRKEKNADIAEQDVDNTKKNNGGLQQTEQQFMTEEYGDYQAEEEEAKELVEHGEKSTRNDLLKLIDNIKGRHFMASVEKEYVDRIQEDIKKLDRRRMEEACGGYLDYNGDELMELYDRIENEDFLPEIKKNALDNVSKRLWKIRNEEAELLVKRVKKAFDENDVAEDKRLYFYPARDVLEGREDVLAVSHIECAKASYAPNIGQFEYPIVMVDATKRQNGRSGMFITPDAIYYGNFYTYGKIKVEDIEKIDVQKKFRGRHLTVYLNNGRKVRLPGLSNHEELDGYAKTLNDFAAYLKEKPFSRKEKYLAKESHDVICCFRCGYVYKNMKECPKCGYKFNV